MLRHVSRWSTGALEDTHLKSLSHTRSHTFSFCLLILSYVHSVSDLISHSVTLSLYVSPQVMDSVIPESYIIYCFVHPIKHSIFCCTMLRSAGDFWSQILVVQKFKYLILVRCKNTPRYLSFKPVCVFLSPHLRASGLVTSGCFVAAGCRLFVWVLLGVFVCTCVFVCHHRTLSQAVQFFRCCKSIQFIKIMFGVTTFYWHEHCVCVILFVCVIDIDG